MSAYSPPRAWAAGPKTTEENFPMGLRAGVFGVLAWWLALGALALAQGVQSGPQAPQDLSGYATTSGVTSQINALAVQVPGMAPVQSVNTATGVVSVPTVCRQATPAGSPASVSTSDGVVSFTFPNSNCGFATLPSCYTSLASSNSNYVFAAPLRSVLDSTHVVFTVQAALKILGISLGLLTIWGPPPSGTTMDITCVAPPA